MSYFPFILFLLTVSMALYALSTTGWIKWGFIKRLIGPQATFLSQRRKQKDQMAANLHKGHQFEQYIVRKFKTSPYRLIEWRSDKSVDGCFPASSLNPDLVVEFMKSGIRKRFAVECKWRSGWHKGGIEWARIHQIERYKAYQAEEQIRVFVAIGVGGRPGDPAELFVIPLDKIPDRWTYLGASFLQAYKRHDFSFSALNYTGVAR